MAIPTVERLRELFEVTGDGRLIRRTSAARGRAKAGDVAGCSSPSGYLVTRVDGTLLYVHRIVWAMTHGEWPSQQIDHSNRDRADNRPSNLRLATNGENQWNAVKKRKSTSGIKGVTFHSITKKWLCQIWSGGKCIYLGVHRDLELAELIVSEARRKYHGEFARTA